jgi:excinuclease ABC A subunit
MAVNVDQKRLGGGSHSTVGTVTDIHGVLRLLFSRVGKPSAGGAIAYSFNDPRGACPGCCGLGKKVGVVSDDFLDMSKSLNEGAVQVPFFGEWEAQAYTLSGFFDNDKKLSKFTKGEMELLLHGKDRKFKAKFGERTINLTYAGIIERIEPSYIRRDIKTLSERTQKAVMPYLKPRECPSCKGARLSPAALASKINGHNIANLSSLEVGELLKVVRAIKEPKASPIVHALVERLQAVVDIGLEYLSLNRETDTLSGGESQRVRMVKHLGSSLVDVMYIFDEPSVGLHPRDVHRLNELLGKLRDKGNTVIVVEHDPAVIEAADHIVDVGPGAGSGGGTIVFEGTYEKLLKSDTLTGRHLMQALAIKKDVRIPTNQLRIKNARANNLKNISVNISKGVLTAVTALRAQEKARSSTKCSSCSIPTRS